MRRDDGGRWMIRISLALIATSVLALLLAQVFLPGLAAGVIRSRLERYGDVNSVHVSAWPAIELLWGDADSVRVRAGALKLTPERSAELLAEARGTDHLDVSAAEVREGPLLLRNARLSKRGAELFGEGQISQADVAAALPAGVAITLLGSAAGQVRVRVSGGLFGPRASVEALAGAVSGALVAHPAAGPLAHVSLRLFSDPRIEVEGVAARARAGTPPGYRLALTARLR
jgi:hypothetical protein